MEKIIEAKAGDITEVLLREPKECPHCGGSADSTPESQFKCSYCGYEFCGLCFKPDYEGEGNTIKCPRCKHLLKLPEVKGNDCCVLCGSETKYRQDTPVEERLHYIEGIGLKGVDQQLCPECYVFAYGCCDCWECRLVLFFRRMPARS